MASNPTKLTIDAAARIDGRGTIVAGAGIGGGFKLVAPFSLILDEMVFLSQPTVIEEMDYQTRNKIRNSLSSAELNFDIINAMPGIIWTTFLVCLCEIRQAMGKIPQRHFHPLGPNARSSPQLACSR